MELLSPRTGSRLLIVGVGTGLDFEHLPGGVEVVATDLSPQMVERAAKRAAASGVEAQVRVMDGERLEFPDSSFDHVVLHLILAVIPDPLACAREVSRVLRPGGTVSVFDKFVSDNERPSMLRRALNIVTNAAFSDINRKLGPILDAGGLELVEREPAVSGLFTIALAQRRRDPQQSMAADAGAVGGPRFVPGVRS
ncbi:MAG: methyltransferase domain-containing protein [Gemmatimonadota bacterium]|nr:methyltransferase domain-containing protein [Gemmatimonadota bacterium]